MLCFAFLLGSYQIGNALKGCDRYIGAAFGGSRVHKEAEKPRPRPDVDGVAGLRA